MGNLAAVLELLHDADSRWRTLRAVGREWRHTGRSQSAFDAHFLAVEAASSPGSVSRLTGYGPVRDVPIPDEMETRWRLWIDVGGRKRAEFSVGDDYVVVVFDGPTWWSWSSRDRGRTNGGRPYSQHGSGPAQVLLETPSALAALLLEFLGDDQIASRATFSVRGRPRGANDPRSAYELSGLGVGADEYLLAVDAERGVLLRCEARLRDRPFMVIEMTEVTFDADLPAELFTIQLPSGETFDDASQHPPSWKRRRGPSLHLRGRGR
jgi:outer membrane lipoprotein-sorting protein